MNTFERVVSYDLKFGRNLKKTNCSRAGAMMTHKSEDQELRTGTTSSYRIRRVPLYDLGAKYSWDRHSVSKIFLIIVDRF